MKLQCAIVCRFSFITLMLVRSLSNLLWYNFKMYAYIDESGDTGTSSKSSRYFILTAVLFETEDIPKKIIRTIYNKLKHSRNNNIPLHTRNEKHEVKKLLLSFFINKKIKIITCVCNKAKNKSPHYLAHELLAQKLAEKNVLKVYMSQRETNKSINEKLKKYFLDLHILVSMTRPTHMYELQLADFASWVIFQKFEKNEESYSSNLDIEIVKPF